VRCNPAAIRRHQQKRSLHHVRKPSYPGWNRQIWLFVSHFTLNRRKQVYEARGFSCSPLSGENLKWLRSLTHFRKRSGPTLKLNR